MQQQPLAQVESVQHFSRNRLSRGRGLRKTTGCISCRRRHIKCDETKPRCKACTRVKTECIWQTRSRQRQQQQQHHQHDALASDYREGAEPGDVATDHATVDDQSASQHDIPPTPGWHSVDEAAAALVGFRDGWQDARPASVPKMSRDAEGTIGLTERRGASPTVAGPCYDMASSNSQSSTLHPFATSPGLSPVGINSHEWMRSEPSLGQDFNIEDAAHVWANLLLKDASSRAEPGIGTVFPPSYIQNGEADTALALPTPSQTAHTLTTTNDRTAVPCPPFSPTTYLDIDQSLEREAWQSSVPLEVRPHEYPLFHDFIQNLSLWMDFFDPKRPFGTMVPHLAMRNSGLMNAILALSIRHLSLNVRFLPQDSRPQDPLDALPFYFTTLNYIREAMQYGSYRKSLELLATASIVSAYEMLDGSRQDWERHLRGLSCIQQSQGIHGDSGGLKQAVWWTWLCQDVWAAWREGRKPFMTWQPDRSLTQLDNYELAARSVYLFGQIIAFCSKHQIAMGEQDPLARSAEAKVLQQALEQWHGHLPPEFGPLPLSSERQSHGPFQPVWIHPPCFAIAVQLFHCSQVLILANTPCLGGMGAFKLHQNRLDHHVRAICGIAVCLKSDPASVMCSQALFIGSFVHDESQRKAVLEMLDDCWRRAGWPLQSLGVELQEEWATQTI